MSNGIKGFDFESPVIELEEKIKELKNLGESENIDFSNEIKKLQQKCSKLKKDIFSNLTPFQKVYMARHPNRPNSTEYINMIFGDFIEMHGDRNYSDDKSIVGGIADFDDDSIMVIGHQKGRTTEENLMRNFGMARPEGYRKALRLMRLAEKYNLPVITLIDTPGAYPGIGAEERGQAEAIATNLKAMAGLSVPLVSVVIGEGGSGGALGIGVGNRVLMLENSIYSVISPEGCASILWRDASKAPEAALALKLTASDLYKFKIIDEVILEPLGGVHRDVEFVAKRLARSLKKQLDELKQMTAEELIQDRYQKFRQMGRFIDGSLQKSKKK